MYLRPQSSFTRQMHFVGSSCRRHIIREDWRPQQLASGSSELLPPPFGTLAQLVNTSRKGRVVVSKSALCASELLLQEVSLPVSILAPGFCFGCAVSLMHTDACGVPRLPPVPKAGVLSCLECRRLFCGKCRAAPQHVCECSVVSLIDSMDEYDICSLPKSEARTKVLRYSEAVTRLALLPSHATDAASAVKILTSSFASIPFGEYAEELDAAFGRLSDILDRAGEWSCVLLFVCGNHFVVHTTCCK